MRTLLVFTLVFSSTLALAKGGGSGGGGHSSGAHTSSTTSVHEMVQSAHETVRAESPPFTKTENYHIQVLGHSYTITKDCALQDQQRDCKK